ncbi:connector protein [Xanthomonas phage SB3]|uniref:Connector protein n=1 Tax=Xanthomonas phage SB3 TaxID=3117472 RepID=A0ABZ2GUL4_9CAUD
MQFNRTTARQRWDKLDGERKGLLYRCEKYSMWTIPKICPPEHYDQNTESLTHDFQSLGSQCVNHLSNRLTIGLFPAGRPFFRLSPKLNKKRQMQGVPEAQKKALDNGLSVTEREASDIIDNKSLRTKLYDLMKHLLVTGNVMMVLSKDNIRVLGLRSYVCQRDADGKVRELIIKEKIHFDSLDQSVREFLMTSPLFKLTQDKMVDHYRWVQLKAGSYVEEQWVDTEMLPGKFTGKYTDTSLPYRALTWDLASNQHYGTGLVEDNQGDFASLSALSKSTIQAAILASQFKWLVNPMGMTSVEDFEQSENGAVIAGATDDVKPVAANLDAKLQTNIAVTEQYINRIGAAFMLQSAVTRQAERVTTVELRMNAEELEGSLGGAYSRIAVDVQLPIAHWCLKQVDRSVLGSELEPTIITGLAALSRMGDRDRLMALMQALQMVTNVPEDVRDRMRMDVWMADIASAEGFAKDTYILTEAEYEEKMAQRAARAQALAMEQIMAKMQAQQGPQETEE